MKRNIGLIVAILAAAVAGALITYTLTHPKAQEEPAAEAKAPERLSVVEGEPTITLDEKTQREIGIATARVGATAQTDEAELLGTVVDVQELAAIENQVAAAHAQAD